MARNRKMSYLFAIAAATTSIVTWMSPKTHLNGIIENDFITSLKEKLKIYVNMLPEDRIYLQADKPFYEPGDDIWFSCLVLDGSSLKPSSKSDIVHVELINPKGTVEKTIHLLAKHGKVSGDFKLEDELAGGLYKLKAYTNWMKNEGENNAFVKELHVQEVILPALKMKLDFTRKAFGAGDEVIAKLELHTNENTPLSKQQVKFAASLKGTNIIEDTGITDEDGLAYIKFRLPKKIDSNDGLLNVMIDYNGGTESISRSIPIVLNTITFNMYPEGGDMLSGFENRVAFKATNEFGKAADVEGIVIDAGGNKVTAFSSFHQGMGSFYLKPVNRQNYFVKITKPENIIQTFRLPESLDRGYTMSIDNSKASEIAGTVNSTESAELSLIAQVRGKIYYSTVIKTIPGANTFAFSTSDFPAGVSQLTLFDNKGIARAERLVFVNKNKQLTISVETDKEKYLPREKVKMTVSVKDEHGLPSPARLSMAVVNDQLLSFADDKSGTILSQLLLQQDVKDAIEEPAFYFNANEPKADKALDHLLMTSGWRRFTWEKIIEEELPAIKFPGQKTIISGTIYDGNTGKPVANTKIKTTGGETFTSDANGKFSIQHVELYEPENLEFSADNFLTQTIQVRNYHDNLLVYLYNHNTKYSRAFTNAKNLAPQAVMMQGAGVMENDKRDLVVEVLAGAQAKPLAKRAVAAEVKGVKPVRKLNAAKFVPHIAEDKRMDEVAADVLEQNLFVNEDGIKYYRARQFASPDYKKQEAVETRTDFRNTIYWNPDIEIGYSGKKTIEFYTSDDITSFKATVEGMSKDGVPGHAETNFYTQLPFAMLTKVPVQVITEDIVSIPLTLKNNTNGPLGGVLSILAPKGLEELVKTPSVQTIMPGKAKTIYLDYKVQNLPGEGEFTIAFKACGLADAFTQKIKIAPKGFPVETSFSSQEMEKEYEFEISKLVQGSLKASFTAFPNVVADLMKGVEGILQEPYGCFEQTSCTAYPNAMVLDYLKTTGSNDTKTLARATDLLDRGYKRLTSFETSNKGYEWFGANPAHEGLTAYGILEFIDMQKAGQQIDKTMLDRTARWLMNHKDGKGGFEREKRALHDFGRISDDILNAYIVYALSQAGFNDIKKEFNTSYEKAMNLNDPYMLAMMANAAVAMNEVSKGREALKCLLKHQAGDGSFTGSSHSITYSQGSSLTIETTALSLLAMLNSDVKDQNAVNKAVGFLVSARSGSGVFSSTQGTILALKALTEFAKYSKKACEDGTILVYIDNKRVAEKHYKAGDKGSICIEGLEQYIKGEGKHRVKIKYLDVNDPLPYSVAIIWNTSLPQSNKECAIEFNSKLSSNIAAVGETIRLSCTITNKHNSDVPSTMAIIGIPAGFSAQPWQLKELQEKNAFDYYEIKGNNIAVYYRGLGPKAVKPINLDLKAEIPGEYGAPASSAYLYYTNEFKTWTPLEKVTIRKHS